MKNLLKFIPYNSQKLAENAILSRLYYVPYITYILIPLYYYSLFIAYITRSKEGFGRPNEFHEYAFAYVLLPLQSITLCSSIFLTMSLAIDR